MFLRCLIADAASSGFSLPKKGIFSTLTGNIYKHTKPPYNLYVNPDDVAPAINNC